MQIHIENIHLHAGRPPALAAALMSAMFAASATDEPASNEADKPIFKIGERSDSVGGIYAGIASGEDGQPDGHLFLLDDKPSGKLTWADAVKWGESIGDGARLPTRFESALLYANLQDQFEEGWHWTSTQSSGTGAWFQKFSSGTQYGFSKDFEGRARAVRRLVL